MKLILKPLHVARFALLLAAIPIAGVAATLSVNVSGINESSGEIGCAQFKGAEGFPMDNSKATQVWLRADGKGVVCRFTDLSDGTYAVAVSHDFNGNKKVDTNFVGMPTEPWGGFEQCASDLARTTL
jgi:uncharacterized protein (DUF2141 family)